VCLFGGGALSSGPLSPKVITSHLQILMYVRVHTHFMQFLQNVCSDYSLRFSCYLGTMDWKYRNASVFEGTRPNVHVFVQRVEECHLWCLAGASALQRLILSGLVWQAGRGWAIMFFSLTVV
jgi:hypothetical protein